MYRKQDQIHDFKRCGKVTHQNWLQKKVLQGKLQTIKDVSGDAGFLLNLLHSGKTLQLSTHIRKLSNI